MANNSPLRYPGGKSRISHFIARLMQDNDMVGGVYVEPFAGGSGVALNLLFDGIVKDIYINDKDPAIYAFWDSILNHPKKFIKKIQKVDLNIEEWQKQKDIQKSKKINTFDLGFSTFFLNRTNRSGIIKGGVIGGINQSGKWKLDARFNKELLIKKIEKIASYKKHVHLFNLDAVDFLNKVLPKLNPQKTLLYLDPPYYKKADKLYMNYFKHDDHVRVYHAIKNMIHPWVVSYDDQKEIRNIYAGELDITYLLRYSAGPKYHGQEVMFISSNLIVDSKLNPLHIKKAV